jgi:DNA mismatch repair protein MutS2
VIENKHLNTLEYPKILERLAGHTSFSAGRELALALTVSSDLAEAQARQRETSQARAFLATRSDIPLGGIRDVRPQLEQAERAATLLPSDLLDIRQTLIKGRALRRTLTGLTGQFPSLAATAQRIEECSGVIAEIGRCLNERGEVVDEASPALARIRVELAQAHRRLLDRLEHIVNSPQSAPYLQEPFITQRGGRYVIPLKAEFKGRIPGIIHDQSASGATFFIEPLSTVELNNHWRELELEEEREVQRILIHLSSLVGEEAPFIRRTVEALAELDLAFAKARYAAEVNGVEPKLVGFASPWAAHSARPPEERPTYKHPGSTIRLLRARHPLLDPATVVPIDLELDEYTFILVITGPNTGGKTVALKTVGLLAAMAQAGLHIPAAAGSTLSIFEGLYADIGDEQSIEQSLSTFSSHLTNIVGILRQAGSDSLVLLDELGAGTDPVEGAALARAIITHLRQRRTTTLIATHFSELKIYAHNTPGVRNASVEFDSETLAPTYELTIGLPGRSNAFAIARRLGLNRSIIEEAQGLVSPEALEAEALLTEIKTARQEALATRQEAQAAREESRHLEEELRQRLAAVEEEKRGLLAAARQEAQAELETLRRDLDELRKGWRERANAALAPTDREWLKEAREELEELEERVAPPPPRRPDRVVNLEELAPGDMVWVARLQAVGKVLRKGENGEIEVQVGRLRARVRPEEIELWEPDGAAELETEQAITMPQPPPSPGSEIDLRGQTVAEILPLLDKYVDDAYLAGLPWVRIIHGKGTGALREAVRRELAGHPLVASQRPGEANEGGEGVTVAELASR